MIVSVVCSTDSKYSDELKHFTHFDWHQARPFDDIFLHHHFFFFFLNLLQYVGSEMKDKNPMAPWRT